MPVGNITLPTEMLRTCTEGMLYCFSVWAYEVTAGVFWTFMLLGFCLALYIGSARLGSTRAFGFASFAGLVGAIWFAVLELMPWWTASLFILVGGMGVVAMLISER